MMDIRRRILMNADTELPPLYKRVDYIRATSDAYINTGYVPTRYDEFEVDFMFETTTASYGCLFSAGTGTYQLTVLLKHGSNNSYLRYFSSSSAAKIFNIDNSTWYKASLSSSGTLTINGISTTGSYLSEIDGNENTLYIFRRRNNTSKLYGKLKSFKITNNGTMKLNLIPCIRLVDGIAGTYNTVSKTFYSSADSNEEFIPSTLDI